MIITLLSHINFRLKPIVYSRFTMIIKNSQLYGKSVGTIKTVTEISINKEDD